VIVRYQYVHGHARKKGKPPWGCRRVSAVAVVALKLVPKIPTLDMD
jgi:hypothetical protein